MRVLASLQAPRRFVPGSRSPRWTVPAILLGVALFTPVDRARAQDPSMGLVSGRVTTGAGDPVSGATVVATGTQQGTLTLGDGRYRLRLRAGRYELRARMLGYAATSDSVIVVAGQTATVDFTITRAATALAAVAVVGTRGDERSIIDAPVPIDVLTVEDIKSSGRTETAQIIQMLAPSFNFPRATIGDGTDHTRPATLRGLGPDQVLVLVNGKRRHTSALINVNGTIGRGTSGVDLNAIPASMIERIEVLRDGAAAQYGSDAIAGVINIILKSGNEGEISSTLGRAFTDFEQIPGESVDDGEVAQVAANYGFASGPSRFLHFGGEFRDRGYTNRTLSDRRPQYFGNSPSANDPNMPTRGRVNHRQGDAATRDLSGFVNAATTLANDVQLYAFGGASRRDGEAAGFFRRPRDDRTVRSIHPNGFLPLITTDISDASGAVGARGNARGFQWNLSTLFGRSSFGFNVERSNNVSLGDASPTEFHAGTLVFGQWTTNLDLFREVRPWTLAPLRLAVGAEFRRDNFQIQAGDPDSYRDGGVRIIDSLGNPTSRIAAVGAQVFPGFRPSDEKDESRTDVAGYIDVESDLTSRFLVGLALRSERYSDFGSNTSGKASTRFTLAPGYALRGAVGTGFRAPSLSQSFYSSTATNFIGGVPFDIKTFPVADTAAKILGAEPLKAEKSRNISAGIAMQPFDAFSLTVDYYLIRIRDRIVFSENFTGDSVIALLRRNGITNVTGGRYFTNAIDTRTNGVDVVASYTAVLAGMGQLRLTGGYNATKNRVTKVIPTPPQLFQQGEALFGRIERARIEVGQPRNNILLSAAHDLGRFTASVRAQRFGEVTSLGATGTNTTSRNVDQTFSAKWITDVSAGLTLLERLTVTVGADNVFDVYPDRNNNVGDPATTFGGNANFGIFPYSGISPFGFNGRFVYVRGAYRLR